MEQYEEINDGECKVMKKIRAKMDSAATVEGLNDRKKFKEYWRDKFKTNKTKSIKKKK